MSAAPARPPRSADATKIFTSGQEFEQLYKDAYQRIDKAITLVTENKHQEVSHLNFIDFFNVLSLLLRPFIITYISDISNVANFFKFLLNSIFLPLYKFIKYVQYACD